MTKPQDKMRAEFEEFAKGKRAYSDEYFFSSCGAYDEYIDPMIEAEWSAWQAACARQSEASSTLAKIAEVAACFGADWPDVDGEPEVLRRVKWAARQLKEQSGQSQKDALDSKPLIVRLAEDFASDCIRSGYVATGSASNTTLMREAQKDALDAARWRYVRAEHEDGPESVCVFVPNDMRECLVPIGSLPGELDAFVDSAIATQGASNV